MTVPEHSHQCYFKSVYDGLLIRIGGIIFTLKKKNTPQHFQGMFLTVKRTQHVLDSFCFDILFTVISPMHYKPCQKCTGFW